MQTSNNHEWIEAKESRKKILVAMTQPMTVKQIARRARTDPDACSYALGKMSVRDLVTCLNPNARNARVYTVTQEGKGCQERLQPELFATRKPVPAADWDLYSWLCFRHRQAVIRVLTEPMQPSEMKRRLRMKAPDIRISANNVRDIIKLFLAKGLVQKIFVRKKAHARYELTEAGHLHRNLLMRAEAGQ